MITIIFTYDLAGEAPAVVQVPAREDRSFWFEEIAPGWGLSNDQEAAIDDGDAVEVEGFVVHEIGSAVVPGVHKAEYYLERIEEYDAAMKLHEQMLEEEDEDGS